MFFYRAGRDFQLFGDLSDTFVIETIHDENLDIEGEADGLPFQYVPEVLIPRNIPT